MAKRGQRIVVRAAQRRSRQRRARLARAEDAKPIHLTERDVAVLEAVAAHRHLSGEQIRRLVLNCGASRARRRLRALFDHDYVDRVSVVAQPTKGIPPFLYVLSPRGAEALNELGIAMSAKSVAVGKLSHVRHRLMINEFHISLVEACRDSPFSLNTWLHEQDLKLPTRDGRGKAEQVEHPSLPRRLPMLPDGYFEIGLPSGESFAYFLEMDLSSHRQRVWRERAQLFTVYANPELGLFRRRFNRDSFRLAVVTPPDFRRRSRSSNILSTIEQTVGPSNLFLVTTLDEIKPNQLLERIWRRPGDDEATSLVENPSERNRVRVAESASRNRVRVIGRR